MNKAIISEYIFGSSLEDYHQGVAIQNRQANSSWFSFFLLIGVSAVSKKILLSVMTVRELLG